MSVHVENASEATLFPKHGRLHEIRATYHLTLTGDDLRAINQKGGIQALEAALQSYLHGTGKP